MNKLEEQIEEAVIEFYETPTVGQNMATNFAHGAQFVIDLDLPVKFAEWQNLRYWKNASGLYVKEHFETESDIPTMGTLEEIYAFWIENIYGK